jgi:hypothetical protein
MLPVVGARGTTLGFGRLLLSAHTAGQRHTSDEGEWVFSFLRYLNLISDAAIIHSYFKMKCLAQSQA